jgi:hypothetical protein
VTRFFFVVAAALVWGSCSDLFAPPPLPDLYKEPYDFSVVVPPYTGPGADLEKPEPHDMSVGFTD